MNQTELNADTLFAFQMALKGHKKFEYQHEGIWLRTFDVSSIAPHRIYHDIPEGWTHHDGEDWKGDKDAVIEEVMYCNGKIPEDKNQPARFWTDEEFNSFTDSNHDYRIYAYKLAAKSPAIPEGFTAWNVGECPVDVDAKVEVIMKSGRRYTGAAGGCIWKRPELPEQTASYRVIEKKVIPWDFATAPLYGKAKRKDSGELFAFECFPMEVVVAQGHRDYRSISYVLFAEKYLQLDGSVCGKEVEQ